MPLPPAPTQRASLLATKHIAKFEKKIGAAFFPKQ